MRSLVLALGLVACSTLSPTEAELIERASLKGIELDPKLASELVTGKTVIASIQLAPDAIERLLAEDSWHSLGYVAETQSWTVELGDSSSLADLLEQSDVVSIAFVMQPTTVSDDTTPPDGTITIENTAGDEDYINSNAVVLDLSDVSDDVDVTQLCIKVGATCNWVNFVDPKSYSLTGTTSGERTVTMRFRDAAGNISGDISDTIVYDRIPPSGGSLLITPTSATATLSWSNITDNYDVESYRLVVASGTSAATASPASCKVGTILYEGTNLAYSHTSLTSGTTYAYRLCAFDAAGNLSVGLTGKITAKSDMIAPTGTISLDGGATLTDSRTVSVAISAVDTGGSGLTQMCLTQNETSCAWKTYATTANYTFSTDGNRVLYAKFRDADGNISAAASDSIVIDATKPTDGTVTVTPASGQLTLAWSGFTDSGTIDAYIVVQGTTSSPASCLSGTEIYNGSGSSTTVTGLTDGTTYFFRVCAVDSYDRMSGGRVVSGKPLPEVDGPTGSLIIAGGAIASATTNLSVVVDAEDVSDVLQYCLYVSGQMCTWKTYPNANNSAFTISWPFSGTGLKTLTVKFRDEWGNASAAISDTIMIDKVGPTSGDVEVSVNGSDVSLTWSGFVDTQTEIASYAVSGPSPGAPPKKCTVSAVDVGTDTEYGPVTVSDGMWYFRVCPTDIVGNVGEGKVVSVTVGG